VISATHANADTTDRDRLVLVADAFSEGRLLADLRRRYPDLHVTECDTYLSAILEISRRPARAVIACVDAALSQPEHALAGLRRAARAGTKVVFCCAPEAEPVVREFAPAEADYVIYPIDGRELDNAIGYGRIASRPSPASEASAALAAEELTGIADSLAALGGKPIGLIERLAGLVRVALRARGVTIIVEGAVATSGDVVTRPVLTAPLTGESGVIGQITVGERTDRPYAPADVERLTHYASLGAHLLTAASRLRKTRELAETDECSGLRNRRHLFTRLAAILAQAREDRFPVTVLLFDVDDFKTYNDAYGHDAGDEIIRVIGTLFQDNCRDQDVVARYGGDEFAVVFWDPEGPRSSGSAHPGCALTVLDRVKVALQSQPIPGAGSGRITISGGLATYPWDGDGVELLIRRADEALLAAKRAGKNRIFLIGGEHPAEPRPM
jgi:diguanylate cyclase (GGDEF)-like protein